MIKQQRFGVENEMTGITRKQAAETISGLFESIPRYVGGGYDAWDVTDREGKAWKLVSDASIHCERATGKNASVPSGREYAVELVSPPLTYDEIPKLQEVIRALREAGAKVNSSCGLHVHIDAANHNRNSLKNLIGIMYQKEDMLFKALKVNESRASRWCKKVREPVLKRPGDSTRMKPKT